MDAAGPSAANCSMTAPLTPTFFGSILSLLYFLALILQNFLFVMPIQTRFHSLSLCLELFIAP